MTDRMPVAELLRMPSMDSWPHHHDGVECYCSELVVRGILSPGLCPSCKDGCRLTALIDAYDREGDFVRPVHIHLGTFFNGHHRLAVASLRGAADLKVIDAPDEDRRVRTDIEAEWLRPEITEIARELSWASTWELRDELERNLDIDLSEGAGAQMVMQIARSALRVES